MFTQFVDKLLKAQVNLQQPQIIMTTMILCAVQFQLTMLINLLVAHKKPPKYLTFTNVKGSLQQVTQSHRMMILQSIISPKCQSAENSDGKINLNQFTRPN